ncbi:MAG: hypothetical protein ACRDYF_11940 [Acidimicrobiia bacterium]
MAQQLVGSVGVAGLLAAQQHPGPRWSVDRDEPGVVEDPQTDADSDADSDSDSDSDAGADNADDNSDNADSDADSGAEVSDGDGTAEESSPGSEAVQGSNNHGASISHIARSTPPGPDHGFVVCTAASGGKCRPDHEAEDADTSDDELDEESEDSSRGHGRANAARAGKKQPRR